MGITTSEFPLLNAAGLYVVHTAGNGNCLFHALSDQIYGDQSKHEELRRAVIKYMTEHADYYKQFIDANPGGGIRRNPKRKNAGSFATQFTAEGPSASEVEATFQSHLKRMARGGTYGDNMEIVAFTRAFGVDVTIYQRDFAYLVSTKETEVEVKNLHIAYHTYEHYSSVRNVTGPHTGIPNTEPVYESVEAAKEAQEKLAKTPYVQDWMIDVVTASLPYIANRLEIQKKLEAAKGDLNSVLSSLLEDAQGSDSASSRRGSSSIEREPDSDDEEFAGPKKKQDRRLSRASRTNAKNKENRHQHDLAVRTKERALPSTQESSSPPAISVNDVKLEDPEETEEEDWQNESSQKDSESASVSTSASDYSTASRPSSGGVRLKLTQPKIDPNKLQPPTKPSKPSAPAKSRPVTYTGTARQPSSAVLPRRRRLYRRDELDMKKAAQKAAAKERKRTNATRAHMQDNVMPLSKSVKENTPAVEARIKVLCI
ncbi:MAG: hypothetical protein Q9214_000834 [Letrouitia sp. 1 TL-2023]